MFHRNLILIALCLASSARSADLLAGNSGVAIPVNAWTEVTPGGYNHRIVGWENFFYTPGIGSGASACHWGMYREVGSERNHSWICYDFRANRWDVLEAGSTWDGENTQEGGHALAGIGVDTTTSTAYGTCCFAISNQSVAVHESYLFDFNAQVGRTKQTANVLPIGNQNTTGAFDPLHHKHVVHGGTSFAGTSEYSVANNTWTTGVACTATASNCPNPSLLDAAMGYDSYDGKLYIFGGQGAGVYQNGVFKYDPVAQTWAATSPSGTPPAARNQAVFVYMRAENLFLLFGGTNGSIIYNDTWIYDPIADSWTQLSPSTNPVTTTSQVFGRGVYFPEDDVVMINVLDSSSVGHTYAFRYWQGAGAGALDPLPTYSASPNSLNINSDSWARSPSIAVDGTTIYQSHTEYGTKAATGNSSYMYPYATKTISGTITNLGGSYNSMATEAPPLDTADIAQAVVAGVSWACWHEGENSVYADRLAMRGWGGSSWSLGGLVVAAPSGFVHFGQCSIADVGGVPYVSFRQYDSSSTTPARTYIQVYYWNGSAFAQVGGNLNRDGIGSGSSGNPQTVGGPPSIVSNGTQPCVAWSEFTLTTASNATTVSVPHVYASCWNGASWATQGGAANVNTSNRATSVSATFMGQLYVAFTERTTTGPAKLYVRTWNGSAWSTVGTTSCTGSCLNRDAVNGWAYRPELINDGSNLYLTYEESGNDQSYAPTYSLLPSGYATIAARPQVYVAKWGSGAWIQLGGTLNKDPVFGAAEHPSIALLSGSPVVSWGEVRYGTLRQIYYSTWTGTDWGLTLSPTPSVGTLFGGTIKGTIK